MSKSNEPAFPIPGYITPLSDGPDGFKFSGPGGLTKRELFAAMILQGLMPSSGTKEDKVACAVTYADLLLAELAEGQPA